MGRAKVRTPTIGGQTSPPRTVAMGSEAEVGAIGLCTQESKMGGPLKFLGLVTKDMSFFVLVKLRSPS